MHHKSETMETREKLEHVVEHVGEHGAAHGFSWTKALAVSTAIIAVLAAIITAFVNHSTNEAILQKDNALFYLSQANDQWAYYQAKSIKLNLAQNTYDQTHNPQLLQDVGRYTAEEATIQKDAQQFETQSNDADKESSNALARGERLDIAALLCEIGIGLSAVSALLKHKLLWIGSLLFAIVGLAMFIPTLF